MEYIYNLLYKFFMKPTTYAILGQLAFRPWAAYELVKEMRRNFHYFYPRAESGLYAELKKLDQLGLARSESQTKGKKDRLVYTITEEGRKVLRDWLSTEPSSFHLEFDGLLRLFLSRFGSPGVVQNALKKTRLDSEELLELAQKVGREYLTGIAPAQSEIVLRACVFDFLVHYALLYKDWAINTENYLVRAGQLKEEDSIELAKDSIRATMKKFGMEGAQHGSL